MRPTIKYLSRGVAVLVLAFALTSCQNSSEIEGLPKDLPVINLHGSPSTPGHSMPHGEYPFESDGDYNTAWAAEGGQGAGMDYSSWRTSHGGAATRSSRGKSGSKSSSKGGSYTIKSGDNLGSIARKNGTTVAKLKAANGLKSDFIRAGKTLRIPK